MKVLFWPYKYKNMKDSWNQQVIWVANTFKSLGYIILKQKDFICNGLEADIYVPERDRNDIDVIIYNHADISEIIGNVVPAKMTLFMKPTVPTPKHTTLDTLGYGPYSSITYNKPDFNHMPDAYTYLYFNTKVKRWIKDKVTKWDAHKSFDIKIEQDDYYLILGQCGGDSVVNRHDFGNYWNKLEAVIKELIRVGDKDIVVKLHPYMNGEFATDTKFSDAYAKKLEAFDKNIHVYNGKSNVHDFIEKANCVFLANSGAGFECMMHHKPMVVWGCPEYHWVAYDLRHLADIKVAIKLEWFDANIQDKFLHWYTEKYCFYDQKTARKRIIDIIGCDDSAPKMEIGPASEQIKLEIGAGANPTDGYVHLDLFNGPHIEIVAPAWETGLEDNSVREIYGRHIFEHLDKKQVDLTLKEWYRILTDDGFIHMIMPDLEYCAKQLLMPGQSKFVNTSNYEHALHSIYGWGTAEQGLQHKCGYTRETIKNLFKKYNFKNVLFNECRECDIDITIYKHGD